MGKTSDDEPDRSRSAKCKKILWQNLLVFLLILAVIFGILIAVGVRTIWTDVGSEEIKRKLFIMKFPGDLLLNMLKMLILPLVMSSLISALAGLDQKASGWMGFRAVLYYFTTTILAVALGILLVLTIRPGERGQEAEKGGKAKDADGVYSLLDLIRSCFPPNLVEATFMKQTTLISSSPRQLWINGTDLLDNTDSRNVSCSLSESMDGKYNCLVDEIVRSPSVKTPMNEEITKPNGMNVLGLIVFSCALGATIARMKEHGIILYQFFNAFYEAIMLLVKLVIWYSPVGVMFLIATKLIEMEDIATVVEGLGYYMLTVLVGLAIHGFIFLPLIYFIATRKNPYTFLFGMTKAMVTAWATASSSATLPVTMKCLVENNEIDERIVRFVTPVGATINMDGTALYEAVAAIFIAQLTGVVLDVGQVITVSVTATAAAIGAAGVPQAGLVTMAIVLTAVGLDFNDISYILAIDWFLDRFRTAINVLGDSYGAGIVEHFSHKDLERMDEEAASPQRDSMLLNENSHLANSALKPPNYNNQAYEDADDVPINTRL